MTRDEFLKPIALLTAAIGKAMDAATIAAWFELLKDLTPRQLEHGVVETLRTYRFAGFPPIGLVRANADGISQRTESLDCRALVAWDRLVTTIRIHGGYRTVSFDDPIIHATVRSLGGWQAIAESTTEDLMRFIQPRFVKAYVALAQFGIGEAEAEPLFGIIDSANSKAGYAVGLITEIKTGLPHFDVKIFPKENQTRALSDGGVVQDLAKSLELPNTVAKPPLGGAAPPDLDGKLKN